MISSLYKCDVVHQRFSPLRYGFHTTMFMWLLDLDELPELEKKTSLLGINKANVYSFRDADHLYLGKPTLKENVVAYLEQHGLPAPDRIEILTNLRVLGYVFNPVSFIFCYNPEGELSAIIAEVHNTFGELKPFLVTGKDLDSVALSASHDKFFYISPFNDLEHKLDLTLYPPKEKLRLFVNNRYEGEKEHFFKASLTGSKHPLTTRKLLSFSLRFPFITLKIITLIHYHALRLWMKGLKPRSKSLSPENQRGILPKKKASSAPITTHLS